MSKQTELVEVLLDNYSIINVDDAEFATREELLALVYKFYPEIPHAPDCPKAKDEKAACDCGIDKPYDGPTYGAG